MSWISDASANRLIQSYMKNFMDVSGNFKVRNSSAVTTSTTSIDMYGELTWSHRADIVAVARPFPIFCIIKR